MGISLKQNVLLTTSLVSIILLFFFVITPPPPLFIVSSLPLPPAVSVFSLFLLLPCVCSLFLPEHVPFGPANVSPRARCFCLLRGMLACLFHGHDLALFSAPVRRGATARTRTRTTEYLKKKKKVMLHICCIHFFNWLFECQIYFFSLNFSHPICFLHPINFF